MIKRENFGDAKKRKIKRNKIAEIRESKF